MGGKTIKDKFETLGFFIEKRPIIILIIAFLFISVAFLGAQQIGMSSGTETYVDKDTKVYQDYENLYLRYLGSHSIVLMIEDEDVKSPAVLKAIDRLDKQVLQIPGVSETTHIADPIKKANYVKTGKMEIPDNRDEIQLPDGSFESLLPDSTHTLYRIQISGDINDDKIEQIVVETRESISRTNFPPGTSVIVTGEEDFSIEMENAIREVMPPLMAISLFLIIIALYLIFGGVRWRILPVFTVGLGIIYTFGSMGYLDIPMTMVSMAAFPILIGLGIDYTIQFQNRLEEELSIQSSETDAVVETVKHTAPAVLIALGISSLGFVSLLTSSVPMIRDFGKMLFIGTAMCYLAAQFIGVPLLHILNRKFKKKSSNKSESKPDDFNAIERLMDKATTFSVRRPVPVLVIGGILCISGIYADMSVSVQTDEKEFVPQDLDALINIDNFYKITESGENLHLIVQTDDNTDPEILEWMDEFSTHVVDSRGQVYESESILSAVKSRNSGTIPDSSQKVEEIYSSIPQNQKDRYLYGNSMVMMNLEVDKDLDGESLGNLVEQIKGDIKWFQVPAGSEVTITGNNVVFTAIIDALTTGRVAMTLLGVFLIFVGLLFVYRDWLKALAPVVTMVMVIGWAGGVMYYSDLKYTPMTATLGAMILGIGTEYAIHLMERYYEEKAKGAAPLEAMKESSMKIGKAITTSGFTTIFGFSALLSSPFLINRNFGMITVLIVLLALVSAFVIFPAFMTSLDRAREKRRGRSVS
ncbi:RND family transporter [Methanohalobium sp.]|uniref:efflux RND transporter permease subunit n=1 Tax=Methanohalobium sp. TaxID=2837493 RepID=UPI0025F2EF56|nr:RND family transporter [Methanohalobium sp.]